MTFLSLAPLRGLTDAIYRNTFARHFPGFDLAMAPFLTTFEGSKVKSARLADLLPENNRDLPVVPQILSKDAHQFKILATMLFELGYETVNWNLGCPYPMVANKGRGSGLLPEPDKIASFLETIADMPCRLSIKTRLGRQSSAEIRELIPIFNAFPLQELIIHPRLGIQLYKGKVDLEAFAFCLAHSTNPVAYNGDLCTLADFERLSSRFPEVQRWMIGRGALCDPFLPGQIKGIPLPPHPLVQLKAFHDELFTLYGQRLNGGSHHLGRMKAIWFYLAGSLKNSKKLLKKIQKTKNIETYCTLIDHFFAEEAQWHQPPAANRK
ncbi:MAG: tRNA-dihydrouridine synthase family protein [Desulfurivibrionaceae bacterium]|nr:tRNA-dihydrouridine synthase family protein [Desulfurivibrionaceae bacterium]